MDCGQGPLVVIGVAGLAAMVVIFVWGMRSG